MRLTSYETSHELGSALAQRLAACLAGAFALAAVAVALASSPVQDQSRPKLISGPSPFPDGCHGRTTDPGHEAEPHLAVSPTNPKRMITAWQQDAANAPETLTAVAALSEDGGASWSRQVLRGLTFCTDDTDQNHVADQWASFGADGIGYVASLTARQDPIFAPSNSIAVNRLGPGRDRFSRAVAVATCPDRFGYCRHDRPALTADPFRNKRAYLVWFRQGKLPGGVRFPTIDGRTMFSKTLDGGRTWSAPEVIQQPPIGLVNRGAEIVVKRGGTLVLVFSRSSLDRRNFGGPDDSGRLYASRSKDGGATWSEPVLIARMTLSDVPESACCADEEIVTIEGGPKRLVYVAWPEYGAGNSKLKLARSRNGGLTWSRPITARRGPGIATQPALAVSRRGTVALLWYDTRSRRPGQNALRTQMFFAHSHDRGSTWRERALTAPFNANDPRTGEPLFLGDYQGLAALPGAFGATYALAGRFAVRGVTDVFFSKVRVR